jgi:5-methylcytosine-specific restriction enzyme A
MNKPLKPCSKPNCPNLTYETYCDQHRNARAENNRYYDKYNRSDRSKKFYHSSAWKKVRELIKIRDNGLCQHCLSDKRITVGTIIDHIVPITDDWNKRLEEDNLQLLCQSCHNKKTAEDSMRG